MVDGTLVPLFEKPGGHGEGYYDRKGNYSMNVQVSFDSPLNCSQDNELSSYQLITLPNLRIIDYVVGHCGSVHDATAFRESRTYGNYRQLFKNGEWIWAYSAYASDTWCVTPYKKPLSNLPDNSRFNYHLSRVC